MAYTMTGVITGAAVTGLTSPTYTLSADSTTPANARQSVITALGGTQTNVNTHSVPQPFTVTVDRPRSLRQLGKANLNGLIQNVGRNTYGILIRKGVVPLVGQPYQVALFRASFEVPAGSELADTANLKALCSLAGGFMNSNASGIADTLQNAVL